MSGGAYRAARLAKYFAGFRNKWADFYPSERWIIERLAGKKGLGRVLDVGCASGGLGRALKSRGLAKSYAGIDINRSVIEAAAPSASIRLVCGDILDPGVFRGKTFDTVFNLSCADWNVGTSRIIDASWRKVAPGGRFVISLRLTGGRGVNDVKRSWQPFPGETERANYAVFNAREAIALLAGLPGASALLGYGYWGKPSRTAVTPFKELVFAVFAVTKGKEDRSVPSMELRLPLSLAL
jgi:SAM-dependent methyltransferase